MTLQTSDRSFPEGTIGRLAAAANASEAGATIPVELHLDCPGDLDALADTLADACEPTFDADMPEVALASLDTVRLLIATCGCGFAPRPGCSRSCLRPCRPTRPPEP